MHKSWCTADPKFVGKMKEALLKGLDETSRNLRSNNRFLLAEVKSTGRRKHSTDTVDMVGAMVPNRTKTLEKYADKHTEALERIEDGTYGMCEGECEELIPQKRLEVRPAATMCVECKDSHNNSGYINKSGSLAKINPVSSVIHI